MNSKIAFIFPGQGSQHIGMGKDLLENYKEAENIFSKANKILGFDIKKLCIEGPEDELNNTCNTQPALFTVSMIINNILRDRGIIPDVLAGHSLGEYSAFCSAGAFSFSEGIKLVRKRGNFMNQALAPGEGSMAAIIGLKKEKIESLCSNIEEVVEIANFNTPSQIVVSGTAAGIKEIIKSASNEGAKKVVELDVSGPFHSSLMKPARDNLQKALKQIDFKQIEIPVVVNAHARYVNDIDQIKKALLAQLVSSVLWVDSMELMIENGIKVFVEVGPGRILKGLMRRIDRSVDVYSVNDVKSLHKFIARYEGSI